MRSINYLLAGLIMGGGIGALYGGDVQARFTAPQSTTIGAAPYLALSDARKNFWPEDLPVPTLALDLQPDPASGHNLILTADGFEMTPEDTNGAVVAGTGHGHMFVNGQNIGRMYAKRHHLISLPKGEVTIHVYLGGNDHKVWVANGGPLFVEETFFIE